MSRPSLKFSPCHCNQTAIKQLVAVAGCSDDSTAVSALPDNWTPRQGGPILKDYLNKRETTHESVLKSLMEEGQSVNKDIDDKVRTIAENLLLDIRQNEKDLTFILEKSIPNNGPLSLTDHDISLRHISKLFMEKIQDLVKFKQECFGLEKQRADGLRKVLKSEFQRLVNVGHRTPKDLLHDFDERIYEINQQLLSNSGAYLELEAQLRVKLDERLVYARSVLNQLCLAAPKIVAEESSLQRIRDLKVSESTASKDLSDLAILVMDELKIYVPRMMEIYKTVCSQVYKEFSDQLDIFNNNISIDKLLFAKSTEDLEWHKTNDHALVLALNCNDSFMNVKLNNIDKIIQDDLLSFQKSVSSLVDYLYDTYSILLDIRHIWNSHIHRSSLAQSLIKAGLDDIQTTHDAIELSNEINFNLALEQMRNAADTDKLQQQFDFVMNFANKIEEAYCQHKETEIAKLEDYMNFASIMSYILVSEYDCFFAKHPKVTKQPIENLISPRHTELSISNDVLLFHAPLKQAVFQTELEKLEIIDCENKYLESLKKTFLSIQDYLDHQARQWVNIKRSLVHMRFSLKLLSHSIRAERVNAAYEARLCELRFHDSRLNSHLDAVYSLIDRLPLEASTILSVDAPELYPLCKLIDDMKFNTDKLLAEESVDPEFKRLKICSYAMRLLKYKQLFEESLDAAIEKYKKSVESTIQKARISNVNFMSQLKLFYERGKYAPLEAMKSCNALIKAGDGLEFGFNRTMDALHSRRTQVLVLAEQHMLPLQRAVEEAYKHGVKNLPPNKKK